MPEGIGPASFILQEFMERIFTECSEWMIVLYDNILALAYDHDDAFRKMKIVIDICNKNNLFLKFKKSRLGYEEVNFFGYVCSRDSYQLSGDRFNALAAAPIPRSLKAMQSFLGAALFFKPFVPDYSTLAAPLTDTTKKTFVWSSTCWTPVLDSAYSTLLGKLKVACSIHYPNYDLVWVLRADASGVGVGFVLFQVVPPSSDNEEPVYQPIKIGSRKFSETASRWSTIEQEAYALFYAIQSCSYYLRCKEFILETDHNNLLWIEKSEVGKIVRWRVYMQSFVFKIRHILGRLNLIADFFSRHGFLPGPDDVLDPLSLLILNVIGDVEPQWLSSISQIDLAPLRVKYLASIHAHALAAVTDTPASAPAESFPTSDDILRSCHNSRVGHHGYRRTALNVNAAYPGHQIPMSYIRDFVAQCPICQKSRLGHTDALVPVFKTLLPSHQRKTVGVDVLTITPPDRHGNKYLTVLVVHATKLTAAYASAQKEALDIARNLFQFFATYGRYDELASDLGSEFMADVVKQLVAWLGVHQKFSLVERHESNGVEHTNYAILRHLVALVLESDIKDSWSQPEHLLLCCYILNSSVNSETNMTPFAAHFGTEDATYLQLPSAPPASSASLASEYLRLLDSNLQSLWRVSREYQRKLLADRQSDSVPVAQQQLYVPGSLVLLRREHHTKFKPEKLAANYLGPYRVLSHERGSNDVTIQHLASHVVTPYHVSRLKPFYGSEEEALALARKDYDLFVIAEITAYRGYIHTRETLEFLVRFMDGTEVWKPWDQELFDTIPYETFCRSRPELLLLVHSAKEARKQQTALNALPITEVSPDQVVYVDVRFFGGAPWYAELTLPDLFTTVYVFHCTYGAHVSRLGRHIRLHVTLTRERFSLNHVDVLLWGMRTSPANCTIVTADLLRQHPSLLPDPQAKR